MPEQAHATTPDTAASRAAGTWPSAARGVAGGLDGPAAGSTQSRLWVAGRWRRRPGLRAGLWLLLCIGLLPALAGTGWYLVQLRQAAMQDAYAKADLMAVGTAEALRWVVQDAQGMLAAVAARPKVRALDPGDCDPVFKDFQLLVPAYKALALRRSNGASVCSELPRPPAADGVAAAPWFQAAVRANGFRISGVHPGSVQQPWAVRITYPILGPGGQVDALLVSPLDLRQLHQRLFARLPPQVRVAVVDGSNHLVLQSQHPDERVGKQAVAWMTGAADQLRRQLADPGSLGTRPAVLQFVADGFDGQRRLYSVRAVPLTDWVAVASLPLDETLQAYRDTRNRSLAAALAVLLLVALVAWRVGRGILLPMQGLASAARGVAAGDDSRRAPEAGPRETVAVAREFNRMVATKALARTLLRASEAHHRALIQNLPVAVLIYQADGTVEDCNAQACNLLRLPAA